MGGSWNSDLHRRQGDGREDAVTQEAILHAAFEGRGPGTDSSAVGSWRRWRLALLLGACLVLGVALVLFSPLPGLGLMLVLGVAAGVPLMALVIWLAP